MRCLGYLRPGGALVSATSSVQPVTAALSRDAYSSKPFLEYLRQTVPNCLLVDDTALIKQIGSPKALNVALLASAVAISDLGFTVEELRAAMHASVRSQFVALNDRAIDVAVAAISAFASR